MRITHKLRMDLARCGCRSVVPAVQGEANTRVLEVALYDNGIAWEPKDGTTAAVAFQKPDGTKGLYDKLPNGDAATVITGSTVTATLAPQVLTCAGVVMASIVFYDADQDALATFPFTIKVEKNPAAGELVSDNYYALQNFDQVNAAYSELLERVDALERGGTGGGISKEEKNLILALFKGAAYTADMSAKIAELEALWSVSHKASYNLTGATASNNASAVVENGAYTTTLTAESGYTLTGATVKVTMGGVDITSTAYSNGVISIPSVTGAVVITVEAKEVPSYTITNNLTNVTTDNSATKVTEGDFFYATVTALPDYKLSFVTITMAGVDVTERYYKDGVISIDSVTGDVVITAVGVEANVNLIDTTKSTLDVAKRFWGVGNISSNASEGYAYTELVPVTAGKTYKFTGYVDNDNIAWAYAYHFYDSERVVQNANSPQRDKTATPILISAVITPTEDGYLGFNYCYAYDVKLVEVV